MEKPSAVLQEEVREKYCLAQSETVWPPAWLISVHVGGLLVKDGGLVGVKKFKAASFTR